MAVRWANPQDVAKAATEWTAGQVECRLFNRHNWTLRMTVATRLRNGNMQIKQTCSRRCGVYRVADMNSNGFIVSRWVPRYDEAKAYLLRDGHGKSVGRIDEDGRAVLWREVMAGIRIIEVEDDA